MVSKYVNYKSILFTGKLDSNSVINRIDIKKKRKILSATVITKEEQVRATGNGTA